MAEPSLAVLVGGVRVFESLPGGMVMLATDKSERTNAVRALRSALALMEASGCDVAPSPRDPVNAHIGHEVHQVTPAIKPVPGCA